ncbi:MAG: hypothetical protein WBH61_03335 [Candidatus Methylomirabilis sp.]
MSGFSVYALDSPKVARTIKMVLEKRRTDLVGLMAEGNVSDWADYQRRVGVIQGIDEALRVCDDLEKEAETRR